MTRRFPTVLRLVSLALGAAATVALAGCNGSGKAPPDAGGGTDAGPFVDGSFVCPTASAQACVGEVHDYCESDGEFLTTRSEDCSAMGKICVPGLWCVDCTPGSIGCQGNSTAKCGDDGAWHVMEDCGAMDGYACIDGQCQNLCDEAVANRSYVGCEFYAADLDNAAIGPGEDASAQQYAVVVSNPGTVATDVSVEQNDALYSQPQSVSQVDSVHLLPGDLEVFDLPRREVDGSSSNTTCLPTDRTCPAGEVCVCSHMDTDAPCFCRVSATATGMNDGTNTAVTSRGYRIRSTLPIIAYQFNPLDNVGVFSNDASLLLPTSALGQHYHIVAWPQTIANDNTNPDHDFDSSRTDEDLRAFLTIMGTAMNTHVHVTLGQKVVLVVGAGPVPQMNPGDTLDLDVGPFDVINLETQGFDADFTGSTVESSKPVGVFVGSEASDVPMFDTYANRQCCADHLETSLFPDQTLGRSFSIARMPPRTVALNNAFIDPTRDSVAEVNEPEWVRVQSTASGDTNITTTLAGPDSAFTLHAGESTVIEADQDFLMDSDQPIAVLQALPSQEAVGIPSAYPGGDPALIAVPPVEQYRQSYVFLTPNKYAFDFVTITAQRDTQVMLDGAPLDPLQCTTRAADGIVRRAGDPPPDRVIYGCQLSFPDVIGLPNVRVEDGTQDDGVHTVVATAPVGIIVYGFDAFVSYAYAGGLNLEPLPQ